jgi:hypothetical protein
MKKQLIEGYSITQNGKHFFLYNNQIDIKPVYTGIIAECNNIDQAIDIFNQHIPILGDNISDDDILIKPKRDHLQELFSHFQ